MKIIFTVCGEGLGHSSRCVALAKELEKKGHEIIFCTYGKAIDFIKSYGFNKIYPVDRELYLDGSKGHFSISRSIWRSKGVPFNLFMNYYILKRIMKNEKVDLLISDSFYSSIFSAKSLKIPRLLIINQNIVHDKKRIIRLFGKFVYHLFKKLNNYADQIIIPDFNPPYHICEKHLKIVDKMVFVGPIIRYNPIKYKMKKDIIFCTFGGEPFKLPLYYKLKEIAENNPEHHFVVACGLEEIKDLNSENFEVYSYIKDVDKYLCRAKCTILHGGLSSIHETLCFGKAPLLLYDEKHPEQTNNSLKVDELNAGKAINIRKENNITYINDYLNEVIKMDNKKYMNMYLKNQNGCLNFCKLVENYEKNR